MTIPRLKRVVCRLLLVRQRGGQDLVEYALLAGFVAVAAGIFIPDVTGVLSTIYSRLASKLLEANG